MGDLQWLNCLNPVQRKAVEQPSEGGLQILAGPGSGKTRVLTYRVAYLLKECSIPPEGLVAVTFTNKAAMEMKTRLIALLGPSLASQVVLGTFHGMCVGFLRKHGGKIGLKSNWSIGDRDQQLAYCKTILKEAQFAQKLQEDELTLKPKTLLDSISKAKSQGLSPEAFLQQAGSSWETIMASMYRRYVDLMEVDNCLDFDDILLFGEKLFRSHRAVIAHIQHVLIDEFQDTNTVQYQIMRLLAHRGAVTVVGDPDQGIYGFRHAQAINLQKMTKDLPDTQVILLEENYRSSLSILKASLAVVQQDQERIDKNLFTTHPRVSLPMLRPFQNPQEESGFIAQEIHRLITHTGGQLNYNDFCILMRYNALSRNLEAALKLAGIPIRMIGAQKFFDRAEVKDIIAYLQLADNPTFAPAFERIINTPKRNIGQVTVQAIKAAAQTHNMSLLEVLLQVVRGKQFRGIKSTQVAVFKRFLAVIYHIQQLAQEKATLAEIIDSLLEQTGYIDYLQKTYGLDAVQREQNIQELKAFATHLAEESQTSTERPASPENELSDSPPKNSQITLSTLGLDRLESIVNNSSLSPSDPEDVNPLRHFLVESSLSTDTDTETSKDDKNRPRVTICTCHSSKGLEWPVVFVTAVEEGIFPFHLCHEPEEIKEERRLLFVAMTRAQGILYLTHSATRMKGAEVQKQEVSIFVKKLIKDQAKAGKLPSEPSGCVFAQDVPSLDQTMRGELSAVLQRQVAPENEVERMTQQYHTKVRKTFPIPDGTQQNSGYQRDNFKSNYNRWGKDRPSPSLGRFTSAPSRGSFQPNSQSQGSTSQISSSQPVMAKSKFASQPVRAPVEPKKPVRSTGLHQPFVPPKVNKSTTTEQEDLKIEPVASSTSTLPQPSEETNRLDKMKNLSDTFLSDLKNDVPDDLPKAEDFSNLIQTRVTRSKTKPSSSKPKPTNSKATSSKPASSKPANSKSANPKPANPKATNKRGKAADASAAQKKIKTGS